MTNAREECQGLVFRTEHIHPSHRGHVNKFVFQKSKKTLEVGGWVKCPIGNLKKSENIFIHYFITFLGEHSNVNNVINALLCLCSCFYVQVFVVNYF